VRDASGSWSQKASDDLALWPESPNDRFCCAACEKGGPRTGRLAPAAAATPKCPSGHPLAPFAIGAAGYTCNLCDCDIPFGASSSACRACDYDLCPDCASIVTRDLAEATGAAAASAPEAAKVGLKSPSSSAPAPAFAVPASGFGASPAHAPAAPDDDDNGGDDSGGGDDAGGDPALDESSLPARPVSAAQVLEDLLACVAETRFPVALERAEAAAGGGRGEGGGGGAVQLCDLLGSLESHALSVVGDLVDELAALAGVDLAELAGAEVERDGEAGEAEEAEEEVLEEVLEDAASPAGADGGAGNEGGAGSGLAAAAAGAGAAYRPARPAALSVGDRVVRGPDWDWGDQDGGDEGSGGTVVGVGADEAGIRGGEGEAEDPGWVKVAWDAFGMGANSYVLEHSRFSTRAPR